MRPQQPLDYPLAVIARAELEALLKPTARETGVEIIRDICVELICRTPDGFDPRFLVWRPLCSDRLHILTPKELIRGRG